MQHFFNTTHWTEHPALRVLVLAWLAAAAQTPDAAWVWAACLVLGLVAASQWPDAAPPSPQPELDSPATPLLAKRRSDAARPRVTSSPKAPPLLKAHRDLVTGLSTREHLHATAEAWQQDLRAANQSVCVLQLSLDGITDVSQRYGHEAGNQLRLQVAKRLRQLVRAEDKVVRLSDAEFALLVSCAAEEVNTLSRSLAKRVVQEVQRPLAFRTLSNLHLSCSVGAAQWPLHAEQLDKALQHAGSALAQARSSGRGQTRQYAPTGEAVAA
ncbi:MAG: GGDEF domain-containing protein [Cytophagales bacterium]|nr:GGDEF domain-containing protein [Rhizobacter sp.]